MPSRPPGIPFVTAIEQYLPIIFPNTPPLKRISPVSRNQRDLPSVWLLDFSDGSKAIAKRQIFAPFTRGKPHHLLAVEKEVCDLLADCALPEVYGFAKDLDVIFLEWCGNSTLDDLLQQGDDSLSRFYTRILIDAYARICKSLKTHSAKLSRRGFPGCGVKETMSSWYNLKNRLDFPRLSEHYELGLDDSILVNKSARLHGLIDSLAEADLHLGPTDYNARNIVLDTDIRSVRFIEFSKLGWDWPERRLIQYSTGLGAGRTGGTFRSALDAEICAEYANSPSEWQKEEPSAILGRLDGHHFIFHLLAAGNLIEAISSSERPYLLDLWLDPQRRLRDLRALLARPLSEDGVVGDLRRCFENET